MEGEKKVSSHVGGCRLGFRKSILQAVRHPTPLGNEWCFIGGKVATLHGDGQGVVFCKPFNCERCCFLGWGGGRLLDFSQY